MTASFITIGASVQRLFIPFVRPCESVTHASLPRMARDWAIDSLHTQDPQDPHYCKLCAPCSASTTPFYQGKTKWTHCSLRQKFTRSVLTRTPKKRLEKRCSLLTNVFARPYISCAPMKSSLFSHPIPVIFRIFLYLYPLAVARRYAALGSTEICRLNESTARPRTARPRQACDR
jgi:hypothetical protein